MFAFNRGVYPVVEGFRLGLARNWHFLAGVCRSGNVMRGSRPPIERRPMSFFIRKMSRRAIVQALIALPALSLFRNQPVVDPDEIVEVNGWILKRSDLA